MAEAADPPGPDPPACPPAFSGDFVKEVGAVTRQPNMDVQGTNYLINDSGKIMVYLAIGAYPIDNAACYVNVLKPDMTFFIQSDLMFHYNATGTEFQGLYYYDFIVPNITGVFPVEAYCFYNSSELIDYPDEFDSNITLLDGEVEDLRRFDDDQRMEFIGDGNCNGVSCEAKFFIPVQEGGAEEFLADFRVNAEVWTNKQENFSFWVYDWNASNYVYWFDITKNVPVNPQNFYLEITEDFIQPGGLDIWVKVNVTDFDNGDLDIYHLYASRVYNGSYVGELRGSNEIVVSGGGQFQYDIITSDEPIIDTTSLFTILWIIIAVALLIFGLYAWSGLAFIVWAVLFFINIYISVIVIFIGLLLLFAERKKQN
jgi:hypothetical protein